MAAMVFGVVGSSTLRVKHEGYGSRGSVDTSYWVEGGVGVAVPVPRPKKPTGLKRCRVRAVPCLMECRALLISGVEPGANETRTWIESKLTDEIKAGTTDNDSGDCLNC